MSGTVLLVVTIACVTANAGEVAAKVVGAPFVVRNATEVGVPASMIPVLALVEGAGTVGLVVGLLGAPTVGIAAALGLCAFFVVAVAAHLRAGVLHNIAFPVGFLALATLSAVYFVNVPR